MIAAAARRPRRTRPRSAVAILVAACVVAVGILATGTAATAASTPGQRALAWANARVGTPYVWGGASDSGYDCSGLVMRAYESVGISLAHQSASQFRETANHPVSAGNLKPGDLMFYGSSAGSIYHVGIFAYYRDGQAWMIDAPHSGVPVGYHERYVDFYAATRPAGGTGVAPPSRPTISAPASVLADHAVTLTGTTSAGAHVRIWSALTNGTDNRLFQTVTATSNGRWSYSVRLLHNRLFTASSSGGDSRTLRVRAIWPLVINAPATSPEGKSFYLWGHITDYARVSIYGAAGTGTGGYRRLTTVTAAGNGNWAYRASIRRTWRFYATAEGQSSKVRQTNVLRYPTLEAPQAVVIGAGTHLAGSATSLSTVKVYFKRGSGPWGVAGTSRADAARGWSMGARQRAQVHAYATAVGLRSPVALIRYIYRPTITAPATVGGKGTISVSGTGPAGWTMTLRSAVSGSHSFTTVRTAMATSSGHWQMSVDQGRSRQYYVTVLGVNSRVVSSTITA